jgi:hypothetical protein
VVSFVVSLFTFVVAVMIRFSVVIIILTITPILIEALSVTKKFKSIVGVRLDGPHMTGRIVSYRT